MATIDLGKITASVTVGSTTTGDPGSSASVTNSGTTQDAVFDFTIPRGTKGDTVILGNEEEYTLYNVQGNSTIGAMTQDATTKSISAQTGYYTCETAGGTAAKVASGDNLSLYTLTSGGHFKIKMTYENSAENATLKLGNADAKPLYYNGERAGGSNSWEENEVLSVYYDGTNYQASNSMGGGSAVGKKKLNGSKGYVSLTGTVAPNPTTSGSGIGNYRYIQYPVKEGDVVEIRGIGNGNAWTWGLIDSERNIIESSGGVVDYTTTPLLKVIPSGVDYIIINNYNTAYSNYEWYFAKKGSIGAHEMLTEPYLYKDLDVLSVGQTYGKGDAVTTPGKEFLKISKDIKELNLEDRILSGDLKVYDGNTYLAKKSVVEYGNYINYSSATVESPAFAIGHPTRFTFTIAERGACNIAVSFGESVLGAITPNAGYDATSIATAVSSLTVSGWVFIDNSDGTITATPSTAGDYSTYNLTFSETSGITCTPTYTTDEQTGNTTSILLTITTGNGSIDVTFGDVTRTIAIGSAYDNTTVATALAAASYPGWALADNGDGTLTATRSISGDNSSTEFSITDGVLGISGSSSITWIGSDYVSSFDGSDWSSLTIADYAASAVWESLTVDVLQNIATEQNYVPKLYQELGNNIDGAVSQKVIKDLVTEETECFDYSTADYGLSNTATKNYMSIGKIQNGYIIKCLKVGGTRYVYIAFTNLTVGETYYLNFDYNCKGLPSNKYVAYKVNTNVNWSSGTSMGDSSFAHNAAGHVSRSFNALAKTVYLVFPNDSFGAVDAYATVTNLSVISKNTFDKLGEVVGEHNRNIRELYTKKTDVFNIDSQSIATSDATLITVSKTDTGYLFNSITATAYMYAFGTVGPMVVGREYTLIFDCTYLPNRTVALWLDSANPLSSSHTVVKSWSLTAGTFKNDRRIEYKFIAPAKVLYLRVASNDLGTNKRLELGNIHLYYTDGITDMLSDLGYQRGDGTTVDSATQIGYYTGRQIPPLYERHRVGYKYLFKTAGGGTSIQACAAYNGYLFEFANLHEFVNIYNLGESKLHSRVYLTSIPNGHANDVQFSTKFYDASDTFPLLYVSGGTQNAHFHYIHVYRVTYANDAFSISLVQTITMPDPINGMESSYPNVFLDGSRLWYLNRGGYFYRFNSPNVVDSGNNPITTVTLTESDILDSFVTEGFGSSGQGGCAVNGILYCMAGVPNWDERVYLNVIDLRRKFFINRIDLMSIGWDWEPEGVAYWDGHLYVNSQSTAGVYELFF